MLQPCFYKREDQFTYWWAALPSCPIRKMYMYYIIIVPLLLPPTLIYLNPEVINLHGSWWVDCLLSTVTMCIDSSNENVLFTAHARTVNILVYRDRLSLPKIGLTLLQLFHILSHSYTICFNILTANHLVATYPLNSNPTLTVPPPYTRRSTTPQLDRPFNNNGMVLRGSCIWLSLATLGACSSHL